MRSTLTLPLAALLCLWTATALAHDPWESNALGYNPGAPDAMILRTNRGIAFTQDGGQTWRFLCRAALQNFKPTVGMTTRDMGLLGLFDGLGEITPAGCDNGLVTTSMSGLWVADISVDPTSNTTLYATTARGGDIDNGVFRSVDDGRTWAPVGALERGPFFKQVRASADGTRIYAGVANYFPNTLPPPQSNERVDYEVRWTDNGGASWTRNPIELATDDREAMLLGVDPTNANRVFVGVHACRTDNGCFDETRGQHPDQIRVSDDGGQTWSVLHEVDEIASFGMNDQFIWIGDFQGGFWRLNHDGTNAIELDERLKPGCVVPTDDGLLVCGTDVFGFLLARSTDNGETFEPLASSQNILGNPSCAPSDMDAGFEPASGCRMEWGDLCRESFFDDPNPPTECAGFIDAGTGPGLDAGMTTGSPKGGGCNCQVVHADNRGPAWWWAALLMLGVAARWSGRRNRSAG